MGEIRYAVRLMRRSPAFTAVAVVSLALGIGANTAIFSLMNTILLKKLPVERPQELVEVLRHYPGNPRGNGYYGWDKVERFRESGVFSALTGTAFDNIAPVRTEDGLEEPLVLEIALGNYFQVLGLKPEMGRLLGPGDVPAKDEGDTVVVSWSFWSRRLQRDPAAIGKRIYVHDRPKTIVGVAPRAYVGPRVGARTDVWVAREHGEASVVGRLQPGMTIERARAQLAPVFRAMVEENAARTTDPLNRQITMELDWAGAGFSGVRDRYGKPLALLMAVVGALLLLACINVASMLLARTAGRQRELAVRVGLGASSGRLLRQMLTESMLLAGAGTLAGIALAFVGTGILVRIVGSGRPFERIQLEVTPDWRVLVFTVAIAVATGVLFGLAPAWHAFTTAPGGAPRAGRGGGGGAGGGPLRQ